MEISHAHHERRGFKLRYCIGLELRKCIHHHKRDHKPLQEPKRDGNHLDLERKRDGNHLAYYKRRGLEHAQRVFFWLAYHKRRVLCIGLEPRNVLYRLCDRVPVDPDVLHDAPARGLNVPRFGIQHRLLCQHNLVRHLRAALQQ